MPTSKEETLPHIFQLNWQGDIICDHKWQKETRIDTHTHSMISKRSANRMQTERKKPTFGPSWLQTKRIQIQVEIEESRASWKDSHIYHHHIAPYVSMVMRRESKVHKHCANWTQQTHQHPSYHHDNDDDDHHHHHWYYHTRIQIMCCILRGDGSDRMYLRCRRVDPTSLFRRSEGEVMIMQCNFHRLQTLVFNSE